MKCKISTIIFVFLVFVPFGIKGMTRLPPRYEKTFLPIDSVSSIKKNALIDLENDSILLKINSQQYVFKKDTIKNDFYYIRHNLFAVVDTNTIISIIECRF